MPDLLSYLAQEEDIGSFFLLEDASGLILLESSTAATAIGVVSAGRRSRKRDYDRIHRDDEEFLLIIASLE